jgi:hypothetical protein
MNDKLACSFDEAARNHVLDARRSSVEQRWNWLCEAMEFAKNLARMRAQRGQITLDANLDVWWSPELERRFRKQMDAQG